MPTLDWIGKKAVVNHHKEVPYHLLKCNPELSAGDPGSGNLLIQGDNLQALKALLPYYSGQVKCIYIDPPYNTGNEGWVYNDAVNSPEINTWIGATVGRASEDLSRNDKWLCMMYPRIQLLRQLLAEDGSIFVSIDDHEVHNLRLLLDEIFGSKNFLSTIVWQKKYSASNDSTGIPSMHDYLIVYQKSSLFSRNLLPRTNKQDKAYKNPDNDPRGPWKAADYTCNKTRSERPNLYYPIEQLGTGKEVWPKETRVWAVERKVYLKHRIDNRLWWGKNGQNKKPAWKKFLSEVQGGIVPVTWWPHEEAGHTDQAKKELLNMLGTLPGYMTPKPVKLVKRVLQIASGKNSLVLDSFAGSGTAGHAALELNREDDGNRKFILIEMEENICRNITLNRLTKAVIGYTSATGKKEDITGLGGGFSYCTLGSPLFDEKGKINNGVSFIDLAAHVYFSETGEPIPQPPDGKSPLIGIHQETAIYLLYNGILKDKTPQGGNALTRAVLADLPPHDGPKVIYGTSCRIGDARLRREEITFRQIPYGLRVD